MTKSYTKDEELCPKQIRISPIRAHENKTGGHTQEDVDFFSDEDDENKVKLDMDVNYHTALANSERYSRMSSTFAKVRTYQANDIQNFNQVKSFL